jgi:hypothetical protein
MSRDSLITAHDAMVHLRHAVVDFLTGCGIELHKYPSSITNRDIDCMACILSKDALTLEKFEEQITAALGVPKEYLFRAK